MSVLKNLPHRRQEAWRWTDLAGKLKAQSGLFDELMPTIETPKGVSVKIVSAGESPDNTMSRIAANVTSQMMLIELADGVDITDPIIISELTKGHGRIAVKIGKGASANIIEHHRGRADSFANIDISIDLGEGASLSRIIVQDDPENALRVGTATVTQDTGSNYSQFSLSFGSALTRLETQLKINGTECESLLNAAYLLDGKRHTDITSYMGLYAPENVIRQSVKGVVFDSAKAAFQGKFYVERPAQKTDAEMRHDALLMSDRADVKSKPELEIYADDVECAHGNTIGALDESALFYMRQRGIPLGQAKALLIEAFLVGVFDDIADDDLRDSLSTKIREWLEARL